MSAAGTRNLSELRIKLFADGADLDAMIELARNPLIRGFTTNPTLMRKAGVASYQEFACRVIAAIPDRPVSFEVISDDLTEMERQARKIASWGPNVFAKIPVTDTRGHSSAPLVRELSSSGVKLNVTALLTLPQVQVVADALDGGAPAYISVFAGRIADTGIDPAPLMAEAVRILAPRPQVELIWASPRELLNVLQADAAGCHVITATGDILRKLCLLGKDLTRFSLETVAMFHNDALAAGYSL